MSDRPTGRPTKYREDYCEDVLELIGRQGKSVAWFAKHIEVSRQSIYQWSKDHPAFSDALSRAREWSEATWEDRIEAMMVTPGVNAALVKLYMANRFKWTDRPTDDPSDPDDEARRIMAMVRAMREADAV